MKRICAILLVLSLSMSSFGGITIKAAEEEDKTATGVNVLPIQSKDDLAENYDALSDVNILYAEKEVFDELDVEEVKEVLDNGTDLMVANSTVEDVATAFDIESSITEEKGITAACYVTAENAEYAVMPVYADVIYDDEETVSDEKYVADTDALSSFLADDAEIGATKVVKNEDKSDTTISAEEMYEMVQEKTEDDVLKQVTDEELVTLQTSTLIGNSFCENTKFIYFYKEGTSSGTGTDYEYSTSEAKAGWSKMGSLSLGIYGLRIRTIDSTTYDNVYSVVTAKGMNDKYVTKYKVNVSVSELENNKIIDESVLTGNSRSVTGKLATEVSGTGSIGPGSMTTYAMNPGGQTITTDFSEQYERTWTCSPETASSSSSWKVRPGIVLKKTNGTAAAVTASVSVNYFQVSGGIRTYTIKDSVKCSIKFKNHVEV